MTFAIADPPYPPLLNAAGGRKPRGSRWYGVNFRGNNRDAADYHPESEEWDSAIRHQQLLLDLQRDFDGWAIATAPDALDVYKPLPAGTRIGVWIKPNAMPGAHRLRSTWEPIIVYVPAGRRSNRGRGQIDDHVIANAPRTGFAGAKPKAWVDWVLRAFSFDPSTDTVVDLFYGSGAVARRIEEWVV